MIQDQIDINFLGSLKDINRNTKGADNGKSCYKTSNKETTKSHDQVAQKTYNFTQLIKILQSN